VRRALTVPLLALIAGFVLADSAIVTLALPDILARFDGTVAQVAWVLIAFNVVLAAVVVPVARFFPGRNAGLWCAAGIAGFAAASLVCALAGSLGILIAARCAQALGGAIVLVGSLELLVEATDEHRGVARWISAGVVGTAAGPVLGGLLTDAFSWQSIFIVQVPVAVVAIPAALASRSTPPVRSVDRHRPAVGPNVTLVLLSAALTAALFLLVLLLVDGWHHSPATAAVTVSVVPLTAFLARPLTRRVPATAGVETATGCFLVAGGLVALAFPPSSSLWWTVAPQALVGLGLGLTVDRLMLGAMRDRLPRALHGAWAIGARHLGIVLGLTILTPVFTADLHDAQLPAEHAITRLVLDARIPAQDKVTVARGLGDALAHEHGQVPDLHPAFEQLPPSAARLPATAQLKRDLDSQLERAASVAFRTSFLVGAGLALAAMVSLLWPRRTSGT
jgi:predicted MFS family arabinose efflux permease